MSPGYNSKWQSQCVNPGLSILKSHILITISPKGSEVTLKNNVIEDIFEGTLKIIRIKSLRTTKSYCVLSAYSLLGSVLRTVHICSPLCILISCRWIVLFCRWESWESERWGNVPSSAHSRGICKPRLTQKPRIFQTMSSRAFLGQCSFSEGIQIKPSEKQLPRCLKYTHCWSGSI